MTPVRALIDSAATVNIINNHFIDHLISAGISVPRKQDKTRKCYVRTANGQLLQNRRTLKIGIHAIDVSSKTVEGLHTFTNAAIAKYDIILGIPWLEHHNLDIDW